MPRQRRGHCGSVFDLLAAVGLVVEQDVTAATPHRGPDGSESHVSRDDLGRSTSVLCRQSQVYSSV
jgi:hypothetical protein